MDEPVEKLYFDWLCAKVLTESTRNYVSLMDILFNTEFTTVVQADEHRLSDGLEIRNQFLRERHVGRHNKLNHRPCSIFEMLIALADRASFQTDTPPENWFWEFIRNLGLTRFDRIDENDVPIIEDVLYTFTWRIYEPNGQGGLFPMAYAQIDQRQLEIWYQFCDYLICRGLA